MENKEIVLDTFIPRDYQIPPFNALEKKGYKRIILIWARRCLSGNTHILKPDGSFVLLKDINPGDEILSWDGIQFVPDIVKNKWTTNLKKTYKTKSYSFLPIITSKDHRFANTSCDSRNISWDDISSIGQNRQLLNYAGINNDSVNNYDLASFWGFMLADGYVVNYQQPKFTNTNNEILKRVEYLSKKLFNITPIWREKGNGFDLGLSNGTRGGGTFTNPVKELFRSEGIDIQKSQRRLPASLWKFNRSSLLHFFSALISADGNIYCHKERDNEFNKNRSLPLSVEITLSCGKSDLYAWDIYWLLRKIGVIPQLPYKERGSNWKIKIAKCDNVKQLLSLPIYGKREKQKEALDALSKTTTKRKTFNGCFRARFSVTESHSEELFDIETKNNHNFIANGYVVHNSGKDCVCFNIMIRSALREIGVYFYIFPTYSQAKKVIWDSITNEGKRFLDFIPKDLVVSTNTQEMKIKLTNGSLIQLVGSDNIDGLVGTNPKGIVFSEYAMQSPEAYKFLSPILAANNGWALFASTPRGKGYFWELYQLALKSPDWYCNLLTVEDTNHIPLSVIERERKEGILSEDMIQQEYYCSFSCGVSGSYYIKYIDKLRINGHIGNVEWQNAFPVHTAWDLGVRDSTAIIFFQHIGTSLHIIDYYEKAKEGLEHYAEYLQSKPYIFGKHIAPHDIRVREFGSGITRIEKARQLGINFTMSNQVSIEDGIEAVRSTLNRCYFDERNCLHLIKSLEKYRQEFDSKRKTYKHRPLHDSSSHAADAFRYLCVSLPKITDRQSTPEELEQRYQRSLIGNNQSHLPHIFRTDLY